LLIPYGCPLLRRDLVAVPILIVDDRVNNINLGGISASGVTQGGLSFSFDALEIITPNSISLHLTGVFQNISEGQGAQTYDLMVLGTPHILNGFINADAAMDGILRGSGEPDDIAIWNTNYTYETLELNLGSGALLGVTPGQARDDPFDFEVQGFLEGSRVPGSAVVGSSFGIGFNDSVVFGPRSITFDLTASEVAPIPEPSTMLLLGSGLAGLGWYRRRRKAA